MPKFDYECQSCNLTYEAWTGTIADPDSVRCPQCKSEQIRKLISNFAFHAPVRVEDYTPGELKMAMQQKAIIESKADQVKSGEIVIDVPKQTPKELVPVI